MFLNVCTVTSSLLYQNHKFHKMYFVSLCVKRLLEGDPRYACFLFDTVEARVFIKIKSKNLHILGRRDEEVPDDE